MCFFSTDALLLPGGEAAGEDGDFNRFDVALCDGLPAAFFDALAAVRPVFAAPVLEAFDDFAA
jgi:hypothetical protein